MFGIIFMIVLVMGYFLILNHKGQNKGRLVLEKVMTAFLSAFIYSLVLAYIGHTPIDEQEANEYYYSFGGLFAIYLLYSLPVFLIFGGLYAFFADVYLKAKDFRHPLLTYITGLFVYVLGGFAIIILLSVYLLVLEGDTFGFYTLALVEISTIPALVFYHISLIYKGIAHLRNRKYTSQ